MSLDITNIIHFGLDSMLGLAIVILVLMLRSAYAKVEDLTDATIVSVRSEAQRSIDATTQAVQIAQLKLVSAQQTARADALQEYISHDAKEPDAAKLAPDDTAGRVLRIAERWRSAPVPSSAADDRHGAEPAVRVDPAAPAAGDAVPRP